MKLPLWRRKQKDELDEEVRGHLEMAARERMERGESCCDAEVAARRQFGNVELVKEVTRDAWGWRWLEQLAQDVRYGARQLARNPGFTFVAVLTLALGIGANTAIFSVVNAVMLRPLPYHKPEQLAMLWTDDVKRGLHEEVTSYVTFTEWRRQSQKFADMALFGGNSLLLMGDDDAERMRADFVSAHLFQLLGVQPALGRVFTPEEEHRGERVAVLSHGLWQRRFGGSADVLGRMITIDGDMNSWKKGPRTVRIIGVMPAGFYFPGKDTQFWEPITVYWRWDNESTDRFHNRWGVVGRMKPEVTPQQAQADMAFIGQRLTQAYPRASADCGTAACGDNFPGFAVNVVPMLDQLTGKQLQAALWILLGAVGFVLLIACVNVGNLLLARGATRAREFAVRTALGAGRARLMSQLLTESMLLATIGGLTGLLVAVWCISALKALAPAGLPRIDEVVVDRGVLWFTAGISLLAGLFFGLAPAWMISQRNAQQGLKEGGGASGGLKLHRARGLLVVVECALAVVLLTGAGLLIRSFYLLNAVNPGFNPSNVLLVRISPSPLADDDQTRHMLQEVRMARKHAEFEQVMERIRAVPGVQQVSAISNLLIEGDANDVLNFEGRPPSPTGQDADQLNGSSVTPGFFPSMGVQLLKGRAFTEADTDLHIRLLWGHQRLPVLPAGAPGYAEPMLVNQAFVRRYFGSEDPIGKRLYEGSLTAKHYWYEIVGVVGDMHRQGLDRKAIPEYFVTMAAVSGTATLVVRTEGDPLRLAASVREAVGTAPRRPVVLSITTADEQLATLTAERRFHTALLAVFAGLAVMLAAVGIYGVMHYMVSQRTREIGIRIALGARTQDVLQLVIGHGLGLAMTGVAAGLLAAYWLTGLLGHLLFGVSSTDPATFGGVAVALAAIAFAACFVPARRAAKVDPMVALRYE